MKLLPPYIAVHNVGYVGIHIVQVLCSLLAESLMSGLSTSSSFRGRFRARSAAEDLLGRARESTSGNEILFPRPGGIRRLKAVLFGRHEDSPFMRRPAQVEINGRKVMGQEALASGDVLVISRYQILIGREGSGLVLRVSNPDSASLSSSSAADVPVGNQASIKAEKTKTSSEEGSSGKTNNLVRRWLDRRVWKDQGSDFPPS